VRREGLESLQALVVFLVPFLSALPFFMLGYLTEEAGNYVVYSIYIVSSILLTRHNHRSLSEIGLTRRGFLTSLGLSSVPVAVLFMREYLSGNIQLSPGAASWTAVSYSLFFWFFGGLGQEILFRGLILFSIQRWKGSKAALLASSLLFGLIHFRQGAVGVIRTTVIGAYWGWVALKTRNIVGTTIAHGTYNFLLETIWTGV